MSGFAMLSLSSLYLSRMAREDDTAASMHSLTVSYCRTGSWLRYPMEAPGSGRAMPSNSFSIPAMILRSVDCNDDGRAGAA